MQTLGCGQSDCPAAVDKNRTNMRACLRKCNEYTSMVLQLFFQGDNFNRIHEACYMYSNKVNWLVNQGPFFKVDHS